MVIETEMEMMMKLRDGAYHNVDKYCEYIMCDLLNGKAEVV